MTRPRVGSDSPSSIAAVPGGAAAAVVTIAGTAVLAARPFVIAPPTGRTILFATGSVVTLLAALTVTVPATLKTAGAPWSTLQIA